MAVKYEREKHLPEYKIHKQRTNYQLYTQGICMVQLYYLSRCNSRMKCTPINEKLAFICKKDADDHKIKIGRAHV